MKISIPFKSVLCYILFLSSGFILHAQTVDSLSKTPTVEGRKFPVSAEKVIENYIAAIGGKENLLRVKDKTTKMSGQFNKMSMSVTIQQKVPNKYISKISFGVLEQTVMYNGVKGETRSPIGTEPIEGNALTRLQFQADLTAITRLKELGVTPVIKAVQKVGERDCYQIEFIFASGGNFIAYYDTASFLKLREESPIHTPQGEYVQITEFRDFKTIAGVDYPFTLIQSIGKRVIPLKVDSIEINTGLEDSLFQ